MQMEKVIGLCFKYLVHERVGQGEVLNNMQHDEMWEGIGQGEGDLIKYAATRFGKVDARL